MQNRVPSQAVARLEDRRAAYAEEVRRLLDASFALIRESGDLAPPVGAIVRRAGLSNQAFYRHFASKDELLLAVLDEGVGMLAGYLAHRMQRAGDPAERVRTWVGGVLEQALQPEAAVATRPFAVSRARLADGFPRQVEESERRLSSMLADAIAEAAAAGQLASADPERDAEAVYTLAMGWVQRRLASTEPASRDEAEHLTAFALRALGAADGA